jgi:hypothetical protein
MVSQTVKKGRGCRELLGIVGPYSSSSFIKWGKVWKWHYMLVWTGSSSHSMVMAATQMEMALQRRHVALCPQQKPPSEVGTVHSPSFPSCRDR